MERLTNFAASTLALAVGASDTVLTVASAALFPNAGNFRVLIDSEILLVTAVSGNNFTITRGAESTTATPHAANASVIGVCTVGALEQYVTEQGGVFPLTALRVLVTDADGNPSASSLTTTVLAFLDATSSVQTQFNGKQPIDPTLTALAGQTIVANSIIIGTGADAFSVTAIAANQFPARSSSGNLVAKPISDYGFSLVDDVDAPAARATLGLGTMALETAVNYALLNSPELTGIPRGPTAAPGSNTDQLATCEYVRNEVAALVDSAPGALDTLQELASALGEDANFAASTATALAGKQPIDGTLTAFAALTIAANSLSIGTGADAFSQVSFGANTFPGRSSSGNLVAKPVTDYGFTIVACADASALRTAAGLGSIATLAAVDFAPVDKATLTYSATTDVDFSAAGGIKTLTLTGNVTFTTSNRTAARQPLLIRIVGDGSIRTFTFPSWKWVGPVPTEIAANKTGVLSLTCFGTADTDVVAAYAVQE